MSAGSVKRIPEDALSVMRKAAEELDAQGIGDNALSVGDRFPEVVLQASDGTDFVLSSLLANGPVLINFYRGGWCPYCNLELKAYQDQLETVRSLGAELVAISPETPDRAMSTAEKNAVTYPVLTDPQNRLAEALGIVFTLPPALAGLYETFGNNLPEAHGEAGWRLPIPATYVVGLDGVIAFASVARDYRTRAEPAEAIMALKKLSKAA
ncbi:peroxiredoxin-like family protein [Parvibaculaceae bacterium PLY_AMNH_Bact1]|nr:peroxiredoxin-like family protein [Parvibaculaceae bacterium PLY_AMNH_Bact1]